MSVRRLLTSLGLVFLAAGCAENGSSPTEVDPTPHLLRFATTQPQFAFEGASSAGSVFASVIGPTPPAVDQSSSATASTASLSWSHTVGNGPSRLLLVGAAIRNANNRVIAVTYGGRLLLPLRAQNNHDGAVRVESWYLVAPPSGTGTVTVTLSGSAKVVGGAVSFTGADQVSPFRGVVSAGSTGTGTDDPVISDSSGAGELVVSAVATDGAAGKTLTPMTGQSQAWNRYYGTAGGDVAGGGSTATGAAGLTMGWTKGKNSKWAIMAAAIKPAVGVSLTQYQATFWAVRGQSRSLQINYSAGGGTSPFLRLTTSDPTYVPGRGTIAVGDSVLVTATVDPNGLAVTLQPHGMLFGTPAQLKIWYGGAGGDLNDDGVVDATDSYIETQLLGMWYQVVPGTPWFPIPATQSLAEKSFTASLQHFSGYSVAW